MGLRNIGGGNSLIFQFGVKIGVKLNAAKYKKTRNALRAADLSGDADRARTDDLLRDRQFRSVCAVVRGCAPGRADVTFTRGCTDLLVCHLCAHVRCRRCDLVSNLVSKTGGYGHPSLTTRLIKSSRYRGATMLVR